MALKSFLHSAFHLFGHPTSEHRADGKNLQVSSNGGMCLQVKVSDSERCRSGFQMPLHYPRYKKADYEKMEEWKLDLLLEEYGISLEGNLEEKRVFAMGAFLWPDQY